MKMYGGVDAYIHIFLTSALVGGEPLNIKKKEKSGTLTQKIMRYGGMHIACINDTDKSMYL
jgi:hypothetical protein